MKSPKIYIVEDNVFYANLLKQEFNKAKYNDVSLFEDGESLMDNLYKMPDVIVLDHFLGEKNGIDILKEVKIVNPNVQIIFLSAQEDINVAVNALKYGAYDYVEKNNNAFARIITMTQRILKFQRLFEENRQYRQRKRLFLTAMGMVALMVTYIGLEYPQIFEM